MGGERRDNLKTINKKENTMKIKNENYWEVHSQFVNEITLMGHVTTAISYWTRDNCHFVLDNLKS